MGNFGVLEDRKLRHVPGTVILDDDDARVQAMAGMLKHGSGKDSHIVLNPQPSNDPNDPLNWPMWRKELSLFTLSFGALLMVAVNAVMLNPAYAEIAKSTGRSLHDIVLIGGYNLLTTGASAPFFCAMSRKYGKRPTFLLSSILAIVGTAIGQSNVSYNRLLTCRIIQGLSTSAYESLVFPVIGDMYFVHQRGLRMAIVNFSILVVTSLATIIAGQVYNSLGLKWMFHMYQIFIVVQLIMSFFLCPESMYHRALANETDEIGGGRVDELVAERQEQLGKESSLGNAISEEVELARTISTNALAAEQKPKKTFLQETAICNGTFTEDNIFILILAPFVTLLNPGALYAIVAGGMFSAFGVMFLLLMAVIFSQPPWEYNAAQVATLSVGPLVGGIIGAVLAAAINDRSAKWMSRRNNGIYEPEFRLVHLWWCVVFLTGGLFLYGHYIEIGSSGALCSFWFGFQKVGLLIGTVSVMSYALDAFRSSSTEIFIISMVFKNMLFYAFSTFATTWYFEKGAFEVGAVLGGVNLGLCLLGIVVYVWGKRLRSFWARHNIMAMLNLHTGPEAVAGH